MFALAQFNPKVGDCAANAQRMLRMVEDAKARGASLIIFPELSLVGYPPRDLLDFEKLIEESLLGLDLLRQASRGIAILCGYVEPNRGPVGKPFFNAAALLRERQLELSYHKQLLPYYDVFEEERYFEPGTAPAFFRLGNQRFAITICEDAWNFSPFLKRLYPHQPLIPIRDQKVDWVVNLSASPFHLGKPEQRRAVFENTCSFTRAGVLFCDQVGGNDDLIFDGGSFALDAKGGLTAQAKSFEEDLLFVDPASHRVETAPISPQSEAEWLEGALVMGLRDYCHKSGVQRVCLGLSGGIDSALVAGVAVRALGAEAVRALALPTRFTSSASLEDARAIASGLGIALRTAAIEPLFERMERDLKEVFGKTPGSLTLENIQPRLRMAWLMALANEENRLLLNTSNKSEIATGYSTMYGDSTGGLSVIGDLTKHQVYALARHMNRGKAWIPERVFQRPPTAELRENQTDQDSLPPYEVLDAMVRTSLEKSQGITGLLSAGFEPKWVEKFTKLYAVSEYKRAQFPPILRVSSRAFGKGRRVPLASAKPWRTE